jgi:hypothetical protein
MSSELVTVEQVEHIRASVAPVVAKAAAMVISTPADYSGAADFLKTLKAAQRNVADFFAPMKAKAHEAHKAITATETETMKPLVEAESYAKRKMLTYQTEQEAIRQAEQQRLQAEADAQARAEQDRLLRLAESRKTPEKQAEYREAAAAVIAPVVQIASTTPVIAGQSIRKTWRARVVNQALVPREWLVVNEKALDAFARATSGGVAVAGVEMYQETTLSSSSK